MSLFWYLSTWVFGTGVFIPVALMNGLVDMLSTYFPLLNETLYRAILILNPDYALDFIRKEIRQNSSEARKFSSADAALAA